jgi:2'-5' RNA ligase
MRTFLALCGSVGTTRRIAEAMEQKAAAMAQAGWKLAWVPPANLHVTLKFFGSIPAESVDAIALCVKKRLAEVPPPTLRFAGTGVFPPPRDGKGAPRVLWIGADGGKALLSLQQALEGDLEAIGFARETRHFHPHLTVARVLEPPPHGDAGWTTDPAALDFGQETIPEIVIYESPAGIGKPHRAGVEYRALARVPFTKA